jgi:hypothetical protein
MAHAELTGKMREVVDELESNPRIVIGKPSEPASLWSPDEVEDCGLDIFVYPERPIYDPEELNDLLLELVEIRPTRMDYFSLYLEGVDRPADRRLVLGRLCFDETVANPVLAGMALQQSTRLHLFPNAGHLLDAMDDRNLYDIPVAELGCGTFDQPDMSAFASAG